MRSAGSILALSVTCGDSSPKGRALGMAVSFPVELQSVRFRQSLSLWERWHCVSNDREGEPAEKENIFRLFPENATSCKKSYNFFLKKAVFPLTALL